MRTYRARKLTSYPTAVTIVAAALFAGAGQTASAQSPYVYAWCAGFLSMTDAQRIRGPGRRDALATSCYFTSYRECEAVIAGIGGYCYPSPYFAPGYVNRRLRQ